MDYEEDLKKFYTDLADREPEHYVTFVKLAGLYFDEEKVKQRTDELINIERSIVVSFPNNSKLYS